MTTTKYVTQWDADTGDVIGVNAVGWTTQEGTLTRYPKYGTRAVVPIKRRTLEISNSVSGRARLSYNASSADANRADFEIVTVVIPSLLTASQFEVTGRGASGAFGNGYVVEGNPVAKTLALARYVAGTRTQIGSNVAKTFSKYAEYGLFDGTSGCFIQSIDTNLLSFPEDMDIRIEAALNDWTPVTVQDLVSQNDSDSSNFSWLVRIDSTTGTITFYWSLNGTTLKSATSTVAPSFTDGQKYKFRIDFDSDNGASGQDVRFYTSTDYNFDTCTGTWTQLGATVTVAGAGALYNSTSQVKIGARGSTGNAGMVSGKIHRMQAFNVRGSTVPVIEFNAALALARAASFTSAIINENEAPAVWSVQGTALLDSDSYNGSFFLAMRVYGTYLKIKLWETSATEPLTWDIVQIDANVTAAGLHCLGHNDASTGKKSVFNIFSLATLDANLLTYAEQFDQWTNSTAAVTTNAIAAPDGSITADLITSAGPGSRRTNSFTATATAHIYSVHVKKGSTNDTESILLYNNTTAATLAHAILTYSSGTLSIVAGNAFVIPLPDGWFRVFVYASTGITVGNTLIAYVYAGGTSSSSGDAVYAWGARADPGILPLDYAPVAERPITDLQFDAWRSGENERCFLAEFTAAGYDPTAAPYTRTAKAYVSNVGFISKPWDSPPNKHYEDIIESVPSFTRSMGKDLRGPTSISFGDLVLRNPRTNGRINSRNGMGIKFNGSQQITTTNNLLMPANYTVELWLRVGQWSTDFQAVTLLTNCLIAQNYGAGNLSIDAMGSVSLWNGGSTGSGSIMASRQIGSGGLYHIAGIFNGSTLFLLINGVLVANGSGTYTPTTAGPVNIGGNEAGNYKAPNGTVVDEVRIWKYAKTQAEIQYMMNRRARGNEYGLISCWHLDEGVGTAFNDSGPNALHGTIPSATMWALEGMQSNGQVGGDYDDVIRARINREPLTIWWGNKNWARHNFRPFIRGRIDQPVAPNQDKLKFLITDMSTVFQKPLTNLLTNGPYYPRLIGVMAGMFEPPCIDDTNQVYQISHGACTGNGAAGSGNNALVYDNLVLLESVGKFVAAGGIVNPNTVPVTGHGALTGFRFSFDNDGIHGVPTGAAFATIYYLRVIDANNVTLHPTRADALANTNIIALTTGTGALCTCRSYGWEINESAGTLTIYAARVGRITVKDVQDNSNLATGYHSNSASSPYVNADTLLFGASGLALSRNYLDTDNFATLDAVYGQTGKILQCGIFFDGRLHSYEEAMNEMYRTTNSFGGFTQDGMFQMGFVGPPGTPIVYLTEDDVEDLKLISGIRCIDFTKISMITRKNYLQSGAFPISTTNVNLGGFAVSTSSYGSSNIPLDDFPGNQDYDATARFEFTFRLFLTSSQGAKYMIDSVLKPLYKRRIGIFSFKATWAALANDLTIGQTISLTHSRLGFKKWGPMDPSSGDAAATELDGRPCVVKSISISPNGGTHPVTIEVYRQIHGFYPMGDLI